MFYSVVCKMIDYEEALRARDGCKRALRECPNPSSWHQPLNLPALYDSYTKILNLRIEYRYKKISLNLILRGVNNIILKIL